MSKASNFPPNLGGRRDLLEPVEQAFASLGARSGQTATSLARVQVNGDLEGALRRLRQSPAASRSELARRMFFIPPSEARKIKARRSLRFGRRRDKQRAA